MHKIQEYKVTVLLSFLMFLFNFLGWNEIITPTSKMMSIRLWEKKMVELVSKEENQYIWRSTQGYKEHWEKAKPSGFLLLFTRQDGKLLQQSGVGDRYLIRRYFWYFLFGLCIWNDLKSTVGYQSKHLSCLEFFTDLLFVLFGLINPHKETTSTNKDISYYVPVRHVKWPCSWYIVFTSQTIDSFYFTCKDQYCHIPIYTEWTSWAENPQDELACFVVMCTCLF